MPTHARPDRLARLVRSLEAQRSGTPDFEVIVVDDGSPPETRPPEPPPGTALRLIRQVRAGPAAARNRGAREARAPLLLFVDDDCTVAPDWVAAFVDAHARAPAALLGGATANGLPANPWSSAAEGLLGFLDAEAEAAGEGLDFVASNNIACARADFFAVGGFDADYPLAAGEDRAFCRAWRAAGGPDPAQRRVGRALPRARPRALLAPAAQLRARCGAVSSHGRAHGRSRRRPRDRPRAGPCTAVRCRSLRRSTSGCCCTPCGDATSGSAGAWRGWARWRCRSWR